MTAKREVVFWSCDDTTEQLSYETLNEAVEMYLNGLKPDETPETIEVYGWARMKPTCFSFDVLEYVIEKLDEELGDPEGCYDPVTPKMREAAKAFERAILDEYEPWACERVVTVTINTREWIKENAPDWLSQQEDGCGG